MVCANCQRINFKKTINSRFLVFCLAILFVGILQAEKRRRHQHVGTWYIQLTTKCHIGNYHETEV